MNLMLSTFSDVPHNIDGRPRDNISWTTKIHFTVHNVIIIIIIIGAGTGNKFYELI